MGDREKDPSEELADAYLGHLLDGEPAPDLSELTPDERVDAKQTFELLDAIVGMDPDFFPELGEDQVPMRLGLQPAARADGPEAEYVRRVAEEIELLNKGVVIKPDEEAKSLPDARSDLLLRVVGARIRIVVADSGEFADIEGLLAEADRLFYRFPETAAVGLVAMDEDLSCLLVEPQDCRAAIETPMGKWVRPHPRRPQLPVRSALTAYIEEIEPIWEPPEESLGSLEVEFDVEGVAREIAASTIRRSNQEGSKPSIRTTAKRTAYGALGDHEVDELVRLTVEAQLGEVNPDPDDLEDRISEFGDAA